LSCKNALAASMSRAILLLSWYAGITIDRSINELYPKTLHLSSADVSMFSLCLHNISVTSGFEEYPILIISSAELTKGPKKTQGFFCPLIPFLSSPNTSIGD